MKKTLREVQTSLSWLTNKMEITGTQELDTEYFSQILSISDWYRDIITIEDLYAMSRFLSTADKAGFNGLVSFVVGGKDASYSNGMWAQTNDRSATLYRTFNPEETKWRVTAYSKKDAMPALFPREQMASSSMEALALFNKAKEEFFAGTHKAYGIEEFYENALIKSAWITQMESLGDNDEKTLVEYVAEAVGTANLNKTTTDAEDSENILSVFINGSKETKAAINEMFRSLTGITLNELVERFVLEDKDKED